MSKYELIVIVDAQMKQDEKDSVLKQSTDAVQKAGGTVINSKVWLEKQKFTFRIKRCTEGTYYLINFEGEGDTASKIRQTLRINERILRFAIFKVE